MVRLLRLLFVMQHIVMQLGSATLGQNHEKGL